MFVIASEVSAPATSDRLWILLTTFGRYPLWTRCVEIEGEAIVGSPLTYAFRVWRPDGSDRRVVLVAVVEGVEPGRSVVWSLGVPAIFILRFRLDLSPVGPGCILRHSLEASGLLADTLRGRLERQLGPVVRTFVADAERAFAAMPRSPPDPIVPASPL